MFIYIGLAGRRLLKESRAIAPMSRAELVLLALSSEDASQTVDAVVFLSTPFLLMRRRTITPDTVRTVIALFGLAVIGLLFTGSIASGSLCWPPHEEDIWPTVLFMMITGL